MPQDFVERMFNRGLNWVQPRGHLERGQSSKAENVLFTRSTVKCRGGQEDAFLVTDSVNVASWMDRFYKLNADGTITRYFLSFVAGNVYKATSDWSDDTGTLVDDLNHAQILLPRTSENTLLSGSNVTIDGTQDVHSFQSKGWCYLFPGNDENDNTDDRNNVPVRTDGTDSYLMGLTPPPDFTAGDFTNEDAAPKSIKWTPYFDTTIGTVTQSDFVVTSDGTKGYMFFADPSASNFIELGVFDVAGGTWTIETTVSKAASTSGLGSSNETTRQMAILLDSADRPSCVFNNTTDNVVSYVYWDRSTGTWTLETVTGLLTATGSVAAFIDENDVIHAVASDGPWNSGGDLKYNRREGGAWLAAAETPDASPVFSLPSIYVDTDGVVHLAYVAETTSDILRYAYRTAGGGGSWTVSNIETTVATGPDITGDASGGLYISYFDVNTGNFDLKFYYSAAGGASASWSETTVEAGVCASTSPAHTRIRIVEGEGWADRGVLISFLKVRQNLGSGTSLVPALAFRRSDESTWDVGYVIEAYTATRNVSVFVETPTRIWVAWGDGSESGVGLGQFQGYHYRLTAEYDDGKLGESRPNTARFVFVREPIGDAGFARRIELDLDGGNYDMTKEVTKIHVYRTERYGRADDIYYRAGSVDIAGGDGVPDDDFTDTVRDEDLINNVILDTDKYLPPKFKTGVFWRDRAVIADLKARDTSATDGTELDLTDGGIHHNRIRFSEAFHPDVWPVNNFIDVLPNGESGRIQRVIVNSETDQLYVFLEKDTMAIVGDSPQGERGSPYRPVNIAQSKGTPAPDSVVAAKGLVFYWTNHGIEVIRGGVGRNITSDTIRPLWNQRDSNHIAYPYRINMAQMSKVVGVYDEELELIRWSYPHAANTVNSRELVLHLDRWLERPNADGVFSINTIGYRTYAVWDGEGDRGELFGAEAVAARLDWIYRLNYGTRVIRGNGTAQAVAGAITMRLDPGLSDMGRPDLLKRWKSFRMNAQSADYADDTTDGAVDLDLVVTVDGGAYTANLSNLTLGSSSIKRIASAVPRYTNGSRVGVEITATHNISDPDGEGPTPFELYDIAWWYDTLKARVRAGS